MTWSHRPMTAILLGAAVLASCGDGAEGLDPTLRVPDAGVYDYDALIGTSDSTVDTLAGTLELTSTTPDTITGRWAVPGFTGQSHRAAWNINAYVMPATPTQIPGTLNHRLWRHRNGSDLSCVASYQRVEMSDTFTSTTVCSLRRGN